MTDDPGLTTDEKLAFEALWDVLGGRHGGAHHAMILMRTAARAAVQTRVEALLLAAEKVSAFEAQYPLDDTAYNDDEYDHGRAVHGELRAAVAALTATEQEPEETEGEA